MQKVYRKNVTEEEWRAHKKEQYRRYRVKYRSTEEGKIQRREEKARYFAKYPHKRAIYEQAVRDWFAK